MADPVVVTIPDRGPQGGYIIYGRSQDFPPQRQSIADPDASDWELGPSTADLMDFFSSVFFPFDPFWFYGLCPRVYDLNGAIPDEATVTKIEVVTHGYYLNGGSGQDGTLPATQLRADWMTGDEVDLDIQPDFYDAHVMVGGDALVYSFVTDGIGDTPFGAFEEIRVELDPDTVRAHTTRCQFGLIFGIGNVDPVPIVGLTNPDDPDRPGENSGGWEYNFFTSWVEYTYEMPDDTGGGDETPAAPEPPKPETQHASPTAGMLFALAPDPYAVKDSGPVRRFAAKLRRRGSNRVES